MKKSATSLSERQRKMYLTKCIQIPNAVLAYIDKHTTNRAKIVHWLYFNMTKGKIPFNPIGFFLAVFDVSEEMKFRGVHYGIPKTPSFNEDFFKQLKNEIDF